LFQDSTQRREGAKEFGVMDTLDELREDAIEKIRQSFPQNRRVKRVSKPSADPFYKKRINEYFDRQSWDNLVDDDHVVYNMSDVDYVWAISDKAYLYYLPAFLITSLHQSAYFIFAGIVIKRIGELLPKFTKPQLEALSSFLEFFAQYERNWNETRQHKPQKVARDPILKNVENLQLSLMIRLDEVKDL
jgi:hypothetical protein